MDKYKSFWFWLKQLPAHVVAMIPFFVDQMYTHFETLIVHMWFFRPFVIINGAQQSLCYKWTFKVLKYFCINHGDQRVFSICNHQKCLSQPYPFHFNTFVNGLRPLYIFLSFSVETDFRRQNWYWSRSKVSPAQKELITRCAYYNTFLQSVSLLITWCK